MSTFLTDIAKVLRSDPKTGDKSFYGIVKEKITDGSTVTGYKVSIGGDEDIVEARKMAGAEKGDTVLCTLMANGSVAVTGRKDGDGDAIEAKETANNAYDLAEEAYIVAEDAEDIAELAKESVDIVESHFWTDINGAHISQKEHSTASGNTLINANGMIIAKGDPTVQANQLATFGIDGVGIPSIQIGNINNNNISITNSGFSIKLRNLEAIRASISSENNRIEAYNLFPLYLHQIKTRIIADSDSYIELYFDNIEIQNMTFEINRSVFLTDSNKTKQIELKCSTDHSRLMCPQVQSETSSNSANVVVGSNGGLMRSTASNLMAEHILNETINTKKLFDIQISKYIPKDDGEKVSNDAPKATIGLFSEDVYEIYPEICTLVDGHPDNWSEKGMIAIMLQKMKEQQAEINELKQRVETLENK